jgi:hypothetical protein
VPCAPLKNEKQVRTFACSDCGVVSHQLCPRRFKEIGAAQAKANNIAAAEIVRPVAMAWMQPMAQYPAAAKQTAILICVARVGKVCHAERHELLDRRSPFQVRELAETHIPSCLSR